jgi:hypothetical protein
MGLSLKPHEYRRSKDNPGLATLTKLNPYIRLKTLGGDDPPIYIQRGVFMYEDGEEIPRAKLPPWAVEEVKKLTPKAKKEVGLGDDKV